MKTKNWHCHCCCCCCCSPSQSSVWISWLYSMLTGTWWSFHDLICLNGNIRDLSSTGTKWFKNDLAIYRDVRGSRVTVRFATHPASIPHWSFFYISFIFEHSWRSQGYPLSHISLFFWEVAWVTPWSIGSWIIVIFLRRNRCRFATADLTSWSPGPGGLLFGFGWRGSGVLV